MITPSDLLFAAGGLCLERFGVPTLRRAPPNRGGEELKETFLRAASANAGYYLDRDGVLRKATTDVLRPEWLDPLLTGTRSAYLLSEPAATNVILQSSVFGTTWGVTRASIGTNADTAPDGTVTADRLIEDATPTNTHLVAQGSLTITANANVAISVYAKAGTRSWFQLKLQDSTSADSAAKYFNLATGAIGSTFLTGTGTLVSASSEAVGNGWFRFTLIVNIGNGRTNVTAVMFLATGDNGASYSGDGASYISLWGADVVNNQSVGSSHIETTTTSQTRAVDKLAVTVPTLQTIQSLCWYWRGMERGEVLNAISSNRVWTLSNATNPRLILRPGAAGAGRVVAQFVNAAGTFIQQEQPITSLALGDELELMVALTITGIYPNQIATVRTDYARNGGVVTTGTTSGSGAVDARTYTNSLVGIGAADAAGTQAGVYAHRLLAVARGTGHTIADFRSYWRL